MVKKLSTKNLPDFPDKVTSTVDSGDNMNMLLLDFAKAPGEGVPLKVTCECQGQWDVEKVLKWIERWLANRKYV
jgi:hypothetical protein